MVMGVRTKLITCKHESKDKFSRYKHPINHIEITFLLITLEVVKKKELPLLNPFEM